jgi:hypothetical protein
MLENELGVTLNDEELLPLMGRGCCLLIVSLHQRHWRLEVHTLKRQKQLRKFTWPQITPLVSLSAAQDFFFFFLAPCSFVPPSSSSFNFSSHPAPSLSPQEQNVHFDSALLLP